MDDVRRSLGRRVRQLRADLGLSQEQLSERCSLHWTHISGIERGVYNVKISTLAQLARGFGMTLEELFVGVGGRPKDRSKRQR